MASPRTVRRVLVGTLVAGVALRIGLAFGSYGLSYDIDSFLIVQDVLARDGLELYGVVNGVEPFRWPYPPGFIPWIAASDWLAGWTPLPFHGLVQLPAIAADASLALIAFAYLGRRGASARVRLAAAAAIALGPIFVLVSGYHGQIDSLAILPAVAAVMVWESGGERRAWTSGLLLGVGAAIKVVPAFAVLALLASARSRGEGLVAVACTAAVPALALAPFALADPGGVLTLAEYAGAPGQGGITLALDPGLASFWLRGAPFEPNGLVAFLYDNGVLNLLALVVAAVLLARLRPVPMAGAAIVYLALWALSTGFFFHYLIWGLPFLILAGRLTLAVAIQLLALVPALLFYLAPWGGREVLFVYIPLMLALWALTVATLALGFRKRPPDPAAAHA